jgi:uncharacterized Ntn-hydrolase superfamily protein
MFGADKSLVPQHCHPERFDMTFSIVARCERTGQFGVGAMTAMPAVGKFLTHAWPGTGAAATQALVNPYLGIDGIAALREGLDAEATSDRLRAGDPEIQRRQFAIVDRDGRVAAHTGSKCLAWAGHRAGAGYCVLGNRLEGVRVLDALEETLLATSELRLADRLVDALAAGYAAGGDRKEERSATIFVVDTEEYPLWDVRIDEHDDPVSELRRVHAAFGRDLYPHILEMPRRGAE